MFQKLGAFCLFFSVSVAQAAVVQVVDQTGAPQKNAKILIGQGVDKPFKGNSVLTNEKGQFTTPAEWTSALPVTIEGEGLVRTTIASALPNVGQLSVSQTDGNEKIEIQGTLTDYGQIKTDGKIDVGGFIPALPRQQLIYFDVGWLVSPEHDKLSVLGKELAIPSNLTLPKQQESYIFPITLDKPGFRMYVRKPGRYRFMAVHGQFPLKRVVDDYRNGAAAYDILNHGTLVQSGLVDLDVTGAVANLSVPVNTTLFNSELTLVPPPMAADDVILSVALNPVEGDFLLPSDVKRLKSGQPQVLKAPASKSLPLALSLWFKERAGRGTMKLKEPANAQEVLNLPFNLLYEFVRDQFETQATNVNYKQVSFALQSSPGKAAEFITHVAPPQVSNETINMIPPNAPSSIKPLATLLILSSVQTTGSSQVQTEQRTRLWEVWTPGWVNTAELPNLPALPKSPADKFRWEVLYLGQDGQEITHVSRNAIDL